MPSGFNSSQVGAIVAPSSPSVSGFKKKAAPAAALPKAGATTPNFKARAVRPGGFARGGKARKKKGYFLGGLFAGSPATSSQQSSSNFSQNTSFDPGYTDYFHRTLNRADELYNKSIDKTAEDAVAGFSPDQLAAQENVRGIQGNYKGAFGEAGANFGGASADAGGVGRAGEGAFGAAMAGPTAMGAAQPYASAASGRWSDPGVAESYMSPYVESAAKNIMRLSNQNLFENVLPGVNDTFTGGNAGQFGRERHADITGRAIRDQSETVTGKLGELYNQAYGTAAGIYGTDQSRQANLAGTMGNFAAADRSGFGNLGSQMTSAAAQGVQSQIGAGQAQTGFGQAQQSAGYNDINALNTSGTQQQQLEQQKKSFGMNYPWQLNQMMQGLGQGWNVGSSTWGSSNSSSYGTQQAAQASPFAQALGAVTSVASLGMPGGGTLGGNLLGQVFGMGKAAGGRIEPERFSAGGYAPVVSGVRRMNQKRMPAIKQRLMQQQNGLAPPQMTGFARGGSTSDIAQDKAMVRKGVWQHERAMHDAKRPTQLKLAGGGRPTEDTGSMLLDASGPANARARRRERGYWGRTKDDISELGDLGMSLIRSSPELAREGVGRIGEVPGMVGSAFADAAQRYYDRPFGTLREAITPWLPQNVYGKMVDSSRDLFRGLSDDEGTLLSTAGSAFGASPLQYTPSGVGRKALISAFTR